MFVNHVANARVVPGNPEATNRNFEQVLENNLCAANSAMGAAHNHFKDYESHVRKYGTSGGGGGGNIAQFHQPSPAQSQFKNQANTRQFKVQDFYNHYNEIGDTLRRDKAMAHGAIGMFIPSYSDLVPAFAPHHETLQQLDHHFANAKAQLELIGAPPPAQPQDQ